PDRDHCVMRRPEDPRLRIPVVRVEDAVQEPQVHRAIVSLTRAVLAARRDETDHPRVDRSGSNPHMRLTPEIRVALPHGPGLWDCCSIFLPSSRWRSRPRLNFSSVGASAVRFSWDIRLTGELAPERSSKKPPV